MAMTIEGEFSVVRTEPDPMEAQAQRFQEALANFVGELEAEAKRRVGKRVNLEKRWIADLLQYHGVYEDKILQALKEQEGSELFLNVTRHKTNTASAKLFDMLFPTDDRNWAISPTPVPQIEEDIEAANAKGQEVADLANRMMEQGQAEQAEEMVAEAEQILVASREARAVRDKARAASKRMDREIDDQLRECDYNAECREAIDDACKLGTGIMKGPVKSERPVRKWVEDPVTGEMRLEYDLKAMRGAYYRTDPWHWFPDDSVKKVEKSAGTFERHIYQDSDMRRLARTPGFDKAAINQLIAEGTKDQVPYFYADLRTITGAHTDSGTQAFTVWEYYGSITVRQVLEIAAALGMVDMAADYEDEDHLSEVPVCVWFCNGRILKLAEHPLDTGEAIYSVFCWQKDDASIFGYGVPYTMRDQQAAICAAWRLIMDNASLSAVPQVVIDKNSVEPQDGSWKLRPRKMWLTTRQLPNGTRVFNVEHVDAKVAELLMIINAALQFVDEETGISKLAQGEQGADMTDTAQGMAILINSTNVVFRRVVQFWDDDMTKPNIRRMYDWTMQWSQDPSVRGDFEVDARGSSVLLVREIQSKNMLVFFNIGMSDPELRDAMKPVDAFREVAKAMQIPVETWVRSDEEIEQIKAERANQPPPPDPELLRLEVQREVAQIDAQTKLQLAQIERDLKVMEIVQTSNVELDKLQAMLSKTGSEIAHKERMRASEMSFAERTGEHAGGAV